MTASSGRSVGKISSFIAAGVLAAAGIITGLIPYSAGGYTGVCPSAFQNMTGGTTMGQSWVNMLSGGRCTNYASTMTAIMAVLLLASVAALVTGIILSRRAGTPVPTGPTAGYAAAPPQPGHAPADGADHAPQAGSGYPAAQPAPSGTAGSFDTGLLLAGLAAAAGIILVSFMVQWLSFLPGIVQLLLWTAAGLTAIWQVARKRAGTDPVKLAAAEKWNPAVVARGVAADARAELEAHRARRREAERAAAAYRPVPAPAPATAPAQAPTEFTGDDGLSRTDAR